MDRRGDENKVRPIYATVTGKSTEIRMLWLRSPTFRRGSTCYTRGVMLCFRLGPSTLWWKFPSVHEVEKRTNGRIAIIKYEDDMHDYKRNVRMHNTKKRNELNTK
jgi:hypothetical protein